MIDLSESAMVVAHQAGMNYWNSHRMLPSFRWVTAETMATAARSCGFHGCECEAWLAGFFGARKRYLAELKAETERELEAMRNARPSYRPEEDGPDHARAWHDHSAE
jgi:hypothetical protein